MIFCNGGEMKLLLTSIDEWVYNICQKIIFNSKDQVVIVAYAMMYF